MHAHVEGRGEDALEEGAEVALLLRGRGRGMGRVSWKKVPK